MNIKINNKSHKIKPASEMTIKEYILFFDGLEKKTSSRTKLIRYISITTGIKYRHVGDINISETSTRRLFAYVGEILSPENIPEAKEFYHKKTGKTLYQKSVNWRAMAVRALLEDRKMGNYLEQIVYLLAIYISSDYDNEKVEEIYNELQDYNAIAVLSFVIFFFKKLHPGKNSGRSFLKTLLKKVSINTVKQSSK